MSLVFVVDPHRTPLDPVHPGRARYLLRAGHASVLSRFPFTIILHDAKPEMEPQPLRLKIDPGSKTTGLAVVNDTTGQVVWAAELHHRGQQVHERLDQRRICRRARRQRHTRYRQPRFANRRRREGWLPPSLESRIANVLTWVRRIQRCCPIAAISMELVKFDMALMQNAEMSGVEYQQGTLKGYEVRHYLLEKWRRQCAYCRITGVPFEVEHIVPKSRGGSDRVSNLALSCQPCNKTKDRQTAEEFGHPEVQAHANVPLRDAAAVNTTRWALYHRLQTVGVPVETGSGGRTQWNRTKRGLPKTHWVDAACVGARTPEVVTTKGIVPLVITAMGRHTPADVSHERGGILGQSVQRDECGGGIPHRRYRASRRARTVEDGGSAYRAHRDSGNGLVQPQDGLWHHPGHSCQVLSAVASRRRLPLSERGGSSLRPHRRGVVGGGMAGGRYLLIPAKGSARKDGLPTGRWHFLPMAQRQGYPCHTF